MVKMWLAEYPSGISKTLWGCSEQFSAAKNDPTGLSEQHRMEFGRPAVKLASLRKQNYILAFQRALGEIAFEWGLQRSEYALNLQENPKELAEMIT